MVNYSLLFVCLILGIIYIVLARNSNSRDKIGQINICLDAENEASVVGFMGGFHCHHLGVYIGTAFWQQHLVCKACAN